MNLHFPFIPEGNRLMIAFVVLGVVTGASANVGLQLATNGETDYQVIIADDASVEVVAAADELVGYLDQVAGARFPVVRASVASSDHGIILGRSSALEALQLSIDWEGLGPEGFVIRTIGQKLVIAGGSKRGAINGVYTFLEDVVGCRWYTPTFAVIPRNEALSVGPLDVRKVPVFESRLVFCKAAGNVDWAACQRLNTFTRDIGWLGRKPDGSGVDYRKFVADPRLAGPYRYAVWHVHTLGHNLMLPATEFDKNPEYFAMVEGERQRVGQACLTNPQLIRYIAERAREWIMSDPGAPIISISQGDGSNACQCTDCQAAYQKHGVAGLYMRFVNQVAAEISKSHPDMLVDTLAYQWTREPPKDVTMHENIVVRYAPYVACIYHAYDDCPVNTTQNIYKDLVRWAEITPRVWVWSYILPAHQLHPNPVIGCLSRNFKRMRDAGVKGHFVQTVEGNDIFNGGLIELQSYLLAKLTWDPDYDVQKGIEEFARACYGAAAAHIVSYVSMVTERDTYFLEDRGLGIYDDLYAGHRAKTPIKKEKLREMDKLFDEAERAVSTDLDSLQRVRFVRLAVQYAIAQYADESDPIRAKAMRDALPVARQAGLPDSDAFIKSLVAFEANRPQSP